MPRYNAFTLLELLVVFGVIAVITGLGIYGLARFQSNTEVQASFNDAITLLKTIQNSARNSVSFVDTSTLSPSICSSNGNCVPDYFGIKFNVNGYDVYGCLKSVNNIVCPAENEIPVTSVIFSSVTMSFTGNQCDYIVFQRLTGDILDVTGNPTWLPSSNTICNLNLSNQYGDSRTIEINLTTNSIKDANLQ